MFSLGLVIYELLSGYLPEWPYDWPPPEVKRVREKLGAKLMGWLRRSIEVRPQNRFKNARDDVPRVQAAAQRRRQEAPPRASEQGRRPVAMAESVVPPVPPQVRQVDRSALSLPPLRGPGVGAHAVLPVVRHGAAARTASQPAPCRVPALPPRREDGLALLPVVLRARVRGRDDAALLRQALQRDVPKREVPRAADAVHALLSVVPCQDQTPLEAPGQHHALPALPVGCRHEFLALLPVVHEGARSMSARARPSSMSAAGERVQLFLGEHEREQADRSLPHGEVCVRSMRSPDKKTENEDSAAIIQLGDDSFVLAVADGVGGSVAGREASNAAVRTLSRVLTKLPDETPQLRPAILDAVEAANKTVLGLARGAATTLVVAQLDATRLRSYHVGDSELSAVGQRGRIKQRVVPHSPTGFAVEAGLLDEDEAVQHDQRHVLFNVDRLVGHARRGRSRVAARGARHGAARERRLVRQPLHRTRSSIRFAPARSPTAADRLVERVQARMQRQGRRRSAVQARRPHDRAVPAAQAALTFRARTS